MGDLIVKDNVLMNASYNLELVEQRLILLAIIEARESGTGINANDPLTISAENYINIFGVHRNTAYQALKDACNDLFARQFSYQEKTSAGMIKKVRSRWVSQVAYIDRSACVELIFAPAIVPLITQLEAQFTKYDIEQITDLSSAYAIRLYELLICWRSVGKTPLIEIQEFRQRLGVLDEEYKVVADLKKRVLNIALKQINEHTDIFVVCEQVKQGRTISGFKFIFKMKKEIEVKPDIKLLKAPSAKKSTKIERVVFSGLALINFQKLKLVMPEITEDQIYDIAEKSGEVVEYTLQRMIGLENLFPK